VRTRTRVLVDITLVVLLVGLGLVAYFQPGLQKPVSVPQLTALHRDAIRRLELIYPDGHKISLGKEKDEWFVLQPIHLPANRFHAETLVDLAEATSFAQYPATKLDLARFKLDKPLLKVRFNDVEVALGGTEALNGRRYALYGGTVQLVGDSVASFLDADTSFFVSHALLPAEARPVSLSLPLLAEKPDSKGPLRGAIQLHFENDRWVLTPPDQAVSQDTLNRLVEGWRFAHALQVERIDKARKALATVTIQLKGEPQPVRFDLVATQPDLILARTDVGLQYHVAEPLARRLLSLTPEKAKND
jgi:uncharacterized protein DUF4340